MKNHFFKVAKLTNIAINDNRLFFPSVTMVPTEMRTSVVTVALESTKNFMKAINDNRLFFPSVTMVPIGFKASTDWDVTSRLSPVVVTPDQNKNLVGVVDDDLSKVKSMGNIELLDILSNIINQLILLIIYPSLSFKCLGETLRPIMYDIAAIITIITFLNTCSYLEETMKQSDPVIQKQEEIIKEIWPPYLKLAQLSNKHEMRNSFRHTLIYLEAGE